MAKAKTKAKTKRKAKAKTKAKAKGRGRPSPFSAQLKKIAEFVCARWGATDAELAEMFGVTEKTLNNWKKKHPDFFQSIKEGKNVSDERVVRALYDRALGYSCPDTKFATFEGMITDSQEYTKHYPPDGRACEFWLKNRKPDEWRDKIDHEHSGTVEIIVNVTEKVKPPV